jgi:hypothetical protein
MNLDKTLTKYLSITNNLVWFEVRNSEFLETFKDLTSGQKDEVVCWYTKRNNEELIKLIEKYCPEKLI